MANMKISDLEELEATPDNADLLEIVDMAPTPTSKKITWANIKAAVLTAVGKVNEAVGFTLSGGTTSKTLTVEDTMTLKGYATAAEITAGTEAAKAVAPDQLKYVLDYLADLITAGLAHAIDGIGVLGKEIENIRLRVLMTGQVTITNANTGQPHWLMTTALTSNVTLSRNLPNANYTVLVEVEDADDKDRVGEIKISSKAINGFTITVTGNTNNIDLRWTVVDPNFWTR